MQKKLLIILAFLLLLFGCTAPGTKTTSAEAEPIIDEEPIAIPVRNITPIPIPMRMCNDSITSYVPQLEQEANGIAEVMHTIPIVVRTYPCNVIEIGEIEEVEP